MATDPSDVVAVQLKKDNEGGGDEVDARPDRRARFSILGKYVAP